MFLRQSLLVFIGLCAGGVIAAGVFAFLAIIGVFPRVIGKTGTSRHILLYDRYHYRRNFRKRAMLDILNFRCLPEVWGYRFWAILCWGFSDFAGIFVPAVLSCPGGNID